MGAAPLDGACQVNCTLADVMVPAVSPVAMPGVLFIAVVAMVNIEDPTPDPAPFVANTQKS